MLHLYQHGGALLAAPPGVLLYGPPGVRKDHAGQGGGPRERRASFINLHISTLTEKWYGDSNKLGPRRLLPGQKLQPAIIFIDEIDAVLGTRQERGARGQWHGQGRVCGLMIFLIRNHGHMLTDGRSAGL